jgi:hypothetical protein
MSGLERACAMACDEEIPRARSSLVRIIKGILALNERKPIAHPMSWWFG